MLLLLLLLLSEGTRLLLPPPPLPAFAPASLVLWLLLPPSAAWFLGACLPARPRVLPSKGAASCSGRRVVWGAGAWRFPDMVKAASAAVLLLEVAAAGSR